MKTKSVVQILLLSGVWGVSFLMIRVAGDVFPPFWVALLRSGLGATLLWSVLRLGGKKLPPRQRDSLHPLRLGRARRAK